MDEDEYTDVLISRKMSAFDVLVLAAEAVAGFTGDLAQLMVGHALWRSTRNDFADAARLEIERIAE